LEHFRAVLAENKLIKEPLVDFILRNQNANVKQKLSKFEKF